MYIGQSGGLTYTQDIVPLESGLVGCASLNAIAVKSTTGDATIGQIFGSIEIHPSN